LFGCHGFIGSGVLSLHGGYQNFARSLGGFER
jgi:hypothetical protein